MFENVDRLTGCLCNKWEDVVRYEPVLRVSQDRSRRETPSVHPGKSAAVNSYNFFRRDHCEFYKKHQESQLQSIYIVIYKYIEVYRVWQIESNS